MVGTIRYIQYLYLFPAFTIRYLQLAVQIQQISFVAYYIEQFVYTSRLYLVGRPTLYTKQAAGSQYR
jgi:hypothetical protein